MSAKKTSMVGRVYDYLVKMIMTQEIRCGEKIPETKIAEKLNVSRTPIREALRLLANAGIIKIYPKKYSEVITFSEQDIKDLGVVRVMLDTVSARLAIINGSNADFAKLTEITDECLKAARSGEVLESISLDCDFHMMLSRIAGNPFFLDMQKDLYLKVELLMCTRDMEKEKRIESVQRHYDVIDKLYKRDAQAVIKAIFNHLSEFYELDSQYEKFYLNMDDIFRISS